MRAMKQKSFDLAIILVLLFSAPAIFAQGSAGQAGEFLRWGIGPKALGLGRAFTSVADDASAMYWNAAGLTSLTRTGGTMMFMHIPLRNGASVNYLAGAVPMRLFFLKNAPTNPFLNALQNLDLGLGVLWHSLGDFQFYGADGKAVENQSNNSIGASAVYVSASYPLNAIFPGLSAEGPLRWSNFFKGDFSFGLTTKWIRQDLFGFSGSATGFDVGFKYKHYSELFQLGFSLRDFTGSSLNFKEQITGDHIPTYGVLGVSVSPPLGRLRGLLLSFDYGVVQPGKRKRDVMFGVEYDLSVLNPKMPVKLRVGANSNQEAFTVGINFSPETVLGSNWIPHGDITYANQRSAFDAVGERYAISIDRNPFTARYWYMNAMAHYPAAECGVTFDDSRYHQVLGYLKNTEKAKNPGKRAYRFEAALLRGDIEFQKTLFEFKAAKGTNLRQEFQRKFKNVSRLFSRRATQYRQLDSGKNERDPQLLFQSFSSYVQSLILSGDEEAAVALCKNQGRNWVVHGDLLMDAAGRPVPERKAALVYLQAYALYKAKKFNAALQLLDAQTPQNQMAHFLEGHIAFLQGDYQKVLSCVDDVHLNQTSFSGLIHLPVTSDCTYGDELLFMKGASIFKLSGKPLSSDYLNAFANILRYFPRSDLAKFLNGDDKLFAKLIQYQANRNTEKLNVLVNKMIQSYLYSFSEGTLQVETYTYNYR